MTYACPSSSLSIHSTLETPARRRRSLLLLRLASDHHVLCGVRIDDDGLSAGPVKCWTTGSWGMMGTKPRRQTWPNTGRRFRKPARRFRLHATTTTFHPTDLLLGLLKTSLTVLSVPLFSPSFDFEALSSSTRSPPAPCSSQRCKVVPSSQPAFSPLY